MWYYIKYEKLNQLNKGMIVDMKIGYACLTVGVKETGFRTCIMKNATEEKLLEIIEHNLNSLENIIDYNIKNNVKLFRISSDLIPFGSSDINMISWWDYFQSKLSLIGKKIKDSGIRISMHPGQYTILNSPKEDVVRKAIEDLNYHNRVLTSLEANSQNKIILHIGGVYGDKEEAIKRFIHNFGLLSDGIKERLVIENDDKSYNIDEVLKIGKKLNIPVVYDNLHNEILSFDNTKDDYYWINECSKTWKKEDGVQKIHYSQQNHDKRPGAHSTTIGIEKFKGFIDKLDQDIDIMLEVKDKNLSAVKCINLISKDGQIKSLEFEWSKYKYNILEHSPSHYNEMRNLLKDKTKYPVLEFYKIIEEALDTEITRGNFINGAQHVWGYFKIKSTDKEKSKFIKELEKFEEGERTMKNIKNQLLKTALKYDEPYLMDSYYFDF